MKATFPEAPRALAYEGSASAAGGRLIGDQGEDETALRRHLDNRAAFVDKGLVPGRVREVLECEPFADELRAR